MQWLLTLLQRLQHNAVGLRQAVKWLSLLLPFQSTYIIAL